MFYNKVPEYQRVFLKKKQEALEEELRKQKMEFKEMNKVGVKSQNAENNLRKKRDHMRHKG